MLKTIVVMDPFAAAVSERATKCAVEILSLKDMEVISKSAIINVVPLFLDFQFNYSQIYTYCIYTCLFRLWEKIIFEGQL